VRLIEGEEDKEGDQEEERGSRVCDIELVGVEWIEHLGDKLPAKSICAYDVGLYKCFYLSTL